MNKDTYTTICNKCFGKTWYKTEQPCKRSHWNGEEHIPCSGTLRVIDNSKLDSRFTRFYDINERVEVEWKDGYEDYTGYGCRTNGKKARFFVGKSTGWHPIYLQILRRNSSGGSAILSNAVKSIRGLRVYR